MIRTAKVVIDAGEYDCSALVHESYKPSGVLSDVPWLNTYMEHDILTSHGFVEVPVPQVRRGDVLWRYGHTEMYLGNNLQGGARIDESGGINGRTPGDNTGWEITKSAFTPSRWTRAYHYAGSKTVNLIPAAEVAAQIFEHVIAHEQHGYSQPNSRKNAKFETIEIRWDDGKQQPKEEWEVKPAIISIKGRNTQVYTDFHDVHDLSNPQARDTLVKAYKAANGEGIKTVTLTEEEFAYFAQALRSDWPKHLKDLVDKYKSRSPEGTY